jgi:hypothetical protein
LLKVDGVELTLPTEDHIIFSTPIPIRNLYTLDRPDKYYVDSKTSSYIFLTVRAGFSEDDAFFPEVILPVD